MSRLSSDSEAPLLPTSPPPTASTTRPRLLSFLIYTLAILLFLSATVYLTSLSGYDIHSGIEIEGRPSASWNVLRDVKGWTRWDVGLEYAEVEKVELHSKGKVHLKNGQTYDIEFVDVTPPSKGQPWRVAYRSTHTGAVMDWYWQFSPVSSANSYNLTMGVDIQGPLASVHRLAIGKEAQDAFDQCVPLFKKCAEDEK